MGESNIDVISDLLDFGRHKNSRGKVIKKSVERFADDLDNVFNAVSNFIQFGTRDKSIIANMLKQYDKDLRYTAVEPAVLGYLVYRGVNDKHRNAPSPDLYKHELANILSLYRKVNAETGVDAYSVFRYATMYSLFESQPITLTY